MAHAEKQLVLRFIDEVANGADLELVDELVHADFYSHDAAAGPGSGPLSVKGGRRASSTHWPGEPSSHSAVIRHRPTPRASTRPTRPS
jgi:hypothetical protein